MPNSPETRTILFTSCKGGVGKSTVCANLAMAMAALGQKILLIDCDFGNRCLDIIMGLSDDAVYDIGDAVLGRVKPEEAVVKDGRNEGIHFIAAPYNFSNKMSRSAFAQTVQVIAFIPSDSQPGAFVTEPLSQVCPVAGMGVLVAILHTVQMTASSPSVSQPGALVTVPGLKECPVAGTVSVFVLVQPAPVQA